MTFVSSKDAKILSSVYCDEHVELVPSRKYCSYFEKLKYSVHIVDEYLLMLNYSTLVPLNEVVSRNS